MVAVFDPAGIYPDNGSRRANYLILIQRCGDKKEQYLHFILWSGNRNFYL